MLDEDIIEMIINQFYRKIFIYCFNKLRNEQAAEDCTQEVFFTLFRKRSGINFTAELKHWLYKTADICVKKYISQNTDDLLNIDDFSESIADERIDAVNLTAQRIYEILSPEEGKLLKKYLDTPFGRLDDLAAEMGITKDALYKRIERIKKKIKKNYGKL